MSTGPVSTLVVLALSAAPAAKSGTALPVKTEIVVLSDGPRVVLRPSTSALEIVRDNTVVTRTIGAASGADVPLLLTSGRTLPAQTLPDRISLASSNGQPLPVGDYTLRAIVGYGSDPLNNAAGDSASSFCLVSEPMDLKIT